MTNSTPKLAYPKALHFKFINLDTVIKQLFNEEPTSETIELKCFVDNLKGGYGEFYINLNPKTHEGNINPKDVAYSPFLTSEFEKLFKFEIIN